MLLAAIAGLALYLSTMAPGLLWGDSGDAQARVLAGELSASRELARAHILYYAVAVAVHRFLGVDAAHAANVVSALAGVGTVVGFACLTAMLVSRTIAITCATALLLFSHTLWQLSTQAEVVSTSTMCLGFELVFAVRFMRSGRLYDLLLIALINGLGFCAHNMALLTWPAYACLLLFYPAIVPRPRWLALGLTVVCWLVGASALLIEFAHSATQEGLQAAATSLLVGRFASRVFNVSALGSLVLRTAGAIVLNFPTPLILLAVPGWKRLGELGCRPLRPVLTVMALTFAIFAARYHVPDQYTFLIHSYLFLALLTALGIESLLQRWNSAAVRAVVVVFSVLAPAVYAVAPGLARRHLAGVLPFPERVIPYRDPYVWFLTPWRTGYHGAEQYAREVFDLLPPGATFLVDSTTRMPLEFLQGRDAVRRDIGLPHAWYRWSWAKSVQLDDEKAAELAGKGLLYCASDDPRLIKTFLTDMDRFRFIPIGPVYRVETNGAPPSTAPAPAAMPVPDMNAPGE